MSGEGALKRRRKTEQTIDEQMEQAGTAEEEPDETLPHLGEESSCSDTDEKEPSCTEDDADVEDSDEESVMQKIYDRVEKAEKEKRKEAKGMKRC